MLERPDLFPHLQQAWDAFHVLTSSRRFGFGLGPIPLSEIIAYFNWKHITDAEEQADLIEYITVLDSEFLTQTSKRNAKQEGQDD